MGLAWRLVLVVQPCWLHRGFCSQHEEDGFSVLETASSRARTPSVSGACSGAQEGGVPLASNQIQYSLLYRVPESNGVIEACNEAGATVIAYSPLAQGLLTGACDTHI